MQDVIDATTDGSRAATRPSPAGRRPAPEPATTTVAATNPAVDFTELGRRRNILPAPDQDDLVDETDAESTGLLRGQRTAIAVIGAAGAAIVVIGVVALLSGGGSSAATSTGRGAADTTPAVAQPASTVGPSAASSAAAPVDAARRATLSAKGSLLTLRLSTAAGCVRGAYDLQQNDGGWQTVRKGLITRTISQLRVDDRGTYRIVLPRTTSGDTVCTAVTTPAATVRSTPVAGGTGSGSSTSDGSYTGSDASTGTGTSSGSSSGSGSGSGSGSSRSSRSGGSSSSGSGTSHSGGSTSGSGTSGSGTSHSGGSTAPTPAPGLYTPPPPAD